VGGAATKKTKKRIDGSTSLRGANGRGKTGSVKVGMGRGNGTKGMFILSEKNVANKEARTSRAGTERGEQYAALQK